MIAAIVDIYARNLDYAQRLVGDLRDDQMCVQPAEQMNHAAWVIGHLARTGDRVAAARLLGLEPKMPDNLEPLFDHQSTPVSDRSTYPDKATLLGFLDDAHQRVTAALSQKPDALLDESVADERFAKRFATLGPAFLHVLIGHEQMHLGQLSAWRRVQGLPRV
jgi:hypothetical protein